MAILPFNSRSDLNGKWSIGGFQDNVITLQVSGDKLKSKEKRFAGETEVFEGDVKKTDKGEVEIQAMFGTFLVNGNPEGSGKNITINFSNGMKWTKQ